MVSQGGGAGAGQPAGWGRQAGWPGGWGMPAPPREKFRGLEILIRRQRAPQQQHPEGCLPPTHPAVIARSAGRGDTSLPGKLNQFAPSMPAPDFICGVAFSLGGMDLREAQNWVSTGRSPQWIQS